MRAAHNDVAVALPPGPARRARRPWTRRWSTFRLRAHRRPGPRPPAHRSPARLPRLTPPDTPQAGSRYGWRLDHAARDPRWSHQGSARRRRQCSRHPPMPKPPSSASCRRHLPVQRGAPATHQSRVKGRSDGRKRSAVGHQTEIVKISLDGLGLLARCHPVFWWRQFCFQKPLSPNPGTLSHPGAARQTDHFCVLGWASLSRVHLCPGTSALVPTRITPETASGRRPGWDWRCGPSWISCAGTSPGCDAVHFPGSQLPETRAYELPPIPGTASPDTRPLSMPSRALRRSVQCGPAMPESCNRHRPFACLPANAAMNSTTW